MKGEERTTLNPQRRNIHHHLRPCLKDHQQHPNRARHPIQFQPLVQFLRVRDDVRGVRQRCNLCDAVEHGRELARGGEVEAGEEGGGHARGGDFEPGGLGGS